MIARALAVVLAASVTFGAARASAPVTASLDVLDFIELQIVYTTILARYDERVSPRTLVDGARTGVVAYLGENGIENADAPFTPPRIDAGAGEDLVDALVVRALARYGKRLDGHRLVQAAVAGELAALHDPYSLLFRPRAFAKFNAFLGNGSFGGIGAVVSLDRARGEATIDRVLPGSPAARAGLARGDAIVAVVRRFPDSPVVVDTAEFNQPYIYYLFAARYDCTKLPLAQMRDSQAAGITWAYVSAIGNIRFRPVAPGELEQTVELAPIGEGDIRYDVRQGRGNVYFTR